MPDEQPDTGSLEKFLNSTVIVTVKDGRKFRGKLVQYDEYMNLLMENVEEIGKEGRRAVVLIKGGNVGELSI
ncbi:MAG: LSM domain-containing protein [Candidatus Hadarchaeales archaeon]